jgi:hypothetical protein
MKNICLLLLCVLGISFSFAQTRAITEKGEEVILYDDGTWEYENDDDDEVIIIDDIEIETDIPTNPNLFKKNNRATLLLKSKTIKMGFWINPEEWSFKKSKKPSEYVFKFKKSELRGVVITEKDEMSLLSLKTVALINAKRVATDIEIIKEEYRNVNELDVLLLRMEGTLQGIKFAYYGYYYSSPKGTVQFLTYTFQGLMDEYLIEAEKLLNGLVEIK